MALRIVSRLSPSGPPNILKDTIQVDLGTLPGSSPSLFDFDVPGAKLGDSLLVNPTESLPNTIFIVHWHVLANDKIQIEFFNIDSNPVVAGDQPFLLTFFRG